MSVANLRFQDDGADPRRAAERLQAMATRLERANWKVEQLEEQLADARADARAAERLAKRAQAEADRRVRAAASRPAATQRSARGVDARDGFVLDGRARLAINKTEAAAALGVSVDFFDEHIGHELRVVRRGRRRIYAVAELNKWLEKQGETIR